MFYDFPLVSMCIISYCHNISFQDEDNTETAEDESEEAEEVNIQHEADEEIEEDAESDADSNEDEKILSFKAKMKATNSGSNPEFR